MPTEMELTLEQTQQGVSYEVSVFTMKMEILLEPTSNKLMVEHAEYDESNTYVLERFNTTAGNPVKKILLKLNLSDHRLFKDGGGDPYSIIIQETTSPNPICLMAKASSSQAWLWHRRLSHLNFDTINLLSKNDIVNGPPKSKFIKDNLCPSCKLGKAKRSSFKTKLLEAQNDSYTFFTWTYAVQYG
ncbi:retrovirus-related pol polyprotein from transposon TNT 1-94 [Tanacetum coccineum]